METATLHAPTPAWTLRLPGDRSLELAGGTGSPRRPLIMGVLNLTPDSFSDGGLWLEPERAVERGLRMLAEGADLLDLGAESTRPGGGVYGAGARTVPPAEEAGRLLPALTALRAATAAPISVDTRKGEVARQALAAGADLINDVSALADPLLGRVVAAAGVPLVLMHSRGELATMQRGICFQDLLGEVRAELAAAVRRAVSLGIDESQLVLDPGLGFGKTRRQNLALIRHLGALGSLGRPLLLGASRKSFLARASATGTPPPPPAPPAPPDHRLGGSLAAVAWAASQGAAIVRVHDVAETAQLLDVWQAIADTDADSLGEDA